MAHQRLLKSEFFTDYDIAQLPPLYRLFFQGLWCHADRKGTVEYKPRELKVRILPYDEIDPFEAIEKLVASRFLIRYKAGSRTLLAVRSWDKNQAVHKSERGSDLPDLSQATEIYEPGKQPEPSPLANGQLSPFPFPVPVPSPVPKEEEEEKGPTRPVLLPPPSPPQKPDDPFVSGEAFFAEIQVDRVEDGYIAEEPPRHETLNRWFSGFMMELGGDRDRATATVQAFFANPYWKDRNCPFAAFMKNWRDYVPRRETA